MLIIAPLFSHGENRAYIWKENEIFDRRIRNLFCALHREAGVLFLAFPPTTRRVLILCPDCSVWISYHCIVKTYQTKLRQIPRVAHIKVSIYLSIWKLYNGMPLHGKHVKPHRADKQAGLLWKITLLTEPTLTIHKYKVHESAWMQLLWF